MKKCWMIILAAILFPAIGLADQPLNFRIGVILPLSGDMAQFGQAVRNGIALAQEIEPLLFERIQFIYQDDRYEPKASISAYQNLKAQGINLLHVWGDHPSSAVAPLSERDRLPTLAVLTDPRPVEKMSYVVRYMTQYSEYAQLLLVFLRDKGFKHIGVVHVDDPYYVNLLDGLRQNLKAGESLEIVDKFSLNAGDFKSSIAKIKRKHFDILGVYLMPGQTSIFFRQAHSLGLKLPIFGADVFESRSEIKDAGGAMSGAVYVHNIVQDWFRKIYLDKFGNDYQIAYAAIAHEFAVLAGKLFGQRPGPLDPELILRSILSFPGRDGAAGKCTLRQGLTGQKYFSFPVAVKRIDGEDMTILATSTP